MVYFNTKNPDLGKFWRALEWKMLVYFMTVLEYIAAIWKILCQFGTVCGLPVYFFPVWRVCTKNKSGNPGRRTNARGNRD
jgi:hypothetical protein